MLHVDLSTLAGGTLQEKFDREITRVVEKSAASRSTYLSIKGNFGMMRKLKFP